MRPVLRLLYPLVALLAIMMLAPSPAQAAFGDCKQAPAPESPGTGVAGFFDPGATTGTGPAWSNGAPNYEQYGLAGLTFETYDLGCGPDTARDPGAVIGTMLANWGLEASKFGIALTGGALRAAYHPTYLKALDPLIVNANHTLTHALFNQWVPVVLALLGVWLLYKARDMHLSAATIAVAWGLLVMVAVTAIAHYPVRAGSFADQSVGDTVGAVNASINGQGKTRDPADAAIGGLSNAVLFNQWKMGTFGSSSSATADKYAKAIYTNQTLTYAEAKIVRDDPDGKGKALLDRKANAWEDAAAQVKKSDPDAYEHLTGHNSGDHIAAALVSLFAMLCCIIFLLVSALMMIGCYLIVRLAVVFFPLIATIGVAYSMRGAVKGIATTVAAAVINSIVFGVGAAVTVLAVKILLDPASGIPQWLALLLMAALSVIMWVALKPVRKLTALASPNTSFADGAGALGSSARKVGGSAWGIAKTAGAAYVGGIVAAEAALSNVPDGDEAAPRSEGALTPEPDVEPTPTPAPAAAPAVAATPAAGALPAAPQREAPIAVDPAPAPTAEVGPATPAVDDTQPLREIGAAPTFGEDSEPGTTATFVPGPEAPAPGFGTDPIEVEKEVDEDTGEEVYTVFRPDEVPASDEW